jgi:defect-in-organelle-trafficking protein DotC
VLCCATAWTSTAYADDSLQTLLSASQQSDLTDSIPYVRRRELQSAAQTVGTQAGLADRSAEILADLKYHEHDLDQKWRFTDLLLSAGVLPPVITTVQDTADVSAAVMVVQGAVYHIEEPARFVSTPPTWRDWLFVGLSTDKPNLADFSGALPRDGTERAYWKELITQAYATGRAQANAVFELDTARLRKAYFGMRLFYELHAAGMVTAPQIASATNAVVSKDPNVVVVGQTIFRITAPSGFAAAKQWKPLAP